MGGVRHAPGPVRPERIVYAASPELIKKHVDRAEKAEHEAVSLRETVSALEAKLQVAQADLGRLAHLKEATDGKAPVAGQAVPGQQQIDQLQGQVSKLREELYNSYQLLSEAKRVKSFDKTVQVAEKIIEYRDREILKVNKKLTALIAGAALSLGGALGHYVKPEVKAEKPPALEQKKAEQVKK